MYVIKIASILMPVIEMISSYRVIPAILAPGQSRLSLSPNMMMTGKETKIQMENYLRENAPFRRFNRGVKPKKSRDDLEQYLFEKYNDFRKSLSRKNEFKFLYDNAPYRKSLQQFRSLPVYVIMLKKDSSVRVYDLQSNEEERKKLRHVDSYELLSDDNILQDREKFDLLDSHEVLPDEYIMKERKKFDRLDSYELLSDDNILQDREKLDRLDSHDVLPDENIMKERKKFDRLDYYELLPDENMKKGKKLDRLDYYELLPEKNIMKERKKLDRLDAYEILPDADIMKERKKLNRLDSYELLSDDNIITDRNKLKGNKFLITEDVEHANKNVRRLGKEGNLQCFIVRTRRKHYDSTSTSSSKEFHSGEKRQFKLWREHYVCGNETMPKYVPPPTDQGLRPTNYKSTNRLLNDMLKAKMWRPGAPPIKTFRIHASRAPPKRVSPIRRKTKGRLLADPRVEFEFGDLVN